MLLISKLEAVVRGDIKRLMVIMPPGSAKSTYTSLLFVPWYLAQAPNNRIIAASHSIDLAEDFGRKSRNLIKDHAKDLGFSLREDSQAAGRWMTNQASEYLAAGVGKSIAGFRADLGLIDDPVGSREQAYSETVQKSNYNWYKADFRTRLKPGAKVILIQTRWHELDLAGCLLRDEPNEWTVLHLPLIAKDNDPLGRAPGEMLWNDYLDSQYLLDARKDAINFSALYQGDPSAQDGDYFQRSWIEPYTYEANELPPLKNLRMYVASDHAVSEREQADSSCMIPFGVDENDVIWILPDVYWDRCNSLTAVKKILAIAERRKPITWWMENEKITKSIGPFLRLAMRETSNYFVVEPVTPARDKQTRAQSIRGRMNAGMVRFPSFAKWYPDALTQLLKFPVGAHDDFVDALAYVGLGLDKIISGAKVIPPIDTDEYYKPRILTMKWMKDSDKRLENRRQLAFMDN